MLERDLEKYLVKRCKELQVLCYKFTSPQRRSVPDRILIHKGMVVFAELKAPNKTLTTLQSRELKKLEDSGAFALMVNSISGVECLLQSMTGT